jgi:adenylate cyclase
MPVSATQIRSDLAGKAAGGRKLIAVVYADMVGYSRLIGLDDAGTLCRLRTLRRALIDPAIHEHGGRVVQTGGDSLLVAFDSIDGAVRCAVKVQQHVPVCDGDQPPDRRIRFRIGINIGDVIADGTDLHGDGVNIAARLEAECPVGGICVSRTVRDHVHGRLDLPFEAVGELTLKNIARPVEAFVVRLDPAAQEPATDTMPAGARSRTALFAALAGLLIVGAGGAGWWLYRSAGTVPGATQVLPTSPSATTQAQAPANIGSSNAPRLSIVVLPFTNLGSDPDQDYFADAITDDLTTDLSRISGSVVIAHSTARTYREKAVDVRQIGHELDVRFVLEGSVRRMGDQVEVNAQLVDTDRGAHVWADRFETDRHNLTEAQSEITGRLARTLHLELVEAAGRRIELEKVGDPEASDLIMRGWVLWFRPLSASNHKEAARAFERALEIDPLSVDARIGVATILISNVGTGLSQSPAQDSARAERLLLQAIEQEPNSSRAHEALGTLRRIQNRLDESRIELESAVALARNNAHALLQLGETLMFLGRPADAIPEIEHSMRLNPRDPNAAFGDWALGTCHLLLGHTDEAADLLLRTRSQNPRVYFFHIYLAGALGLRGDVDEARAALADAIRLKPEVTSLTRWSAVQPWVGNPALMALRANTLDIGLHRAGMPTD